jgi:hypothetical protein
VWSTSVKTIVYRRLNLAPQSISFIHFGYGERDGWHPP